MVVLCLVLELNSLVGMETQFVKSRRKVSVHPRLTSTVHEVGKRMNE